MKDREFEQICQDHAEKQNRRIPFWSRSGMVFRDLADFYAASPIEAMTDISTEAKVVPGGIQFSLAQPIRIEEKKIISIICTDDEEEKS